MEEKERVEDVTAAASGAVAGQHKPSCFDVLKEMSHRNLEVFASPLDNVIRADKVRAGTQITIGVGRDVVAGLACGQFRGALFMADEKQYAEVERELAGLADPAAALAQAREALRDLSRCLLPIHMSLAEGDLVNDPIPDKYTVLSFMGSGASDRVTAGEVRAALDKAGAALAALEGK